MIAVDDMPLMTTEKRGFSKFAKVAVPLYKPPSRGTVTKLMDTKYETLSDKVKEDLKSIKNISLTADNWSEKNTNKSYLGLTVHYPESSRIISKNLGCFPLDERHTAAYLGTQLDNLCRDWNILKSSISAVVTDNAANIVKAVKDTFGDSIHLSCFIHTIQLVPKVAMEKTPTLEDIVGQVKRIVTYFKKSNTAADEMRSIQIAAGRTEGTFLKLIQHEEPRWNTTFYMLQRFVLMAPWVSTALFNLRSGPPMLAPEEMQVLEEIIDLLMPFEEITREFSSEDVTCSKVLPVIDCFNVVLAKKKPNSIIGLALYMHLEDQMHLRFDNFVKKFPTLAKASLLDPRFKKLHLEKSALICANTMKAISEEMSENSGCRQLQVLRNPETPIDDGHVDNLWSHHDAKAQNLVVDRDEPGGISSELRNFLAQGIIAREENPFRYWEEAKSAFPNVHRVAMKYLSIPATSVPSERLFSKAAIIDTCRRNRLNPERLSCLVFLSGTSEEDWMFQTDFFSL